MIYKNSINNSLKALFYAFLLVFSACNNIDRTSSETASSTQDQATTAQQSEDHSQHAMDSGDMDKMMAMMQKNMDEMHNVSLSGDPDNDFARLMATHHQGAVKMAEEELANGKDSQLKQLAEKSRNSNIKEIQELQAFDKNHQPVAGDTANTMKMMQPMKGMMAQQDHQSMMAGSTDQSFAKMMTHHHQSGIDMAKMYLTLGKSEELKSKAQKTMDEQQKEKQQLEAWLQQNKQ